MARVGDIVLIEPGTYPDDVAVKHSGTSQNQYRCLSDIIRLSGRIWLGRLWRRR